MTDAGLFTKLELLDTKLDALLAVNGLVRGRIWESKNKNFAHSDIDIIDIVDGGRVHVRRENGRVHTLEIVNLCCHYQVTKWQKYGQGEAGGEAGGDVIAVSKRT